jgi:isoquinoline 1-oxidoreductase subunit beta
MDRLGVSLVHLESACSNFFGVTATLCGEITLKDGRVEQSNFDSYQILRVDETPSIEVYIAPSAEPPAGMGEPGTSAIVRAVTNAIFAATGSACASCRSTRPR